jgi:hypothetical protein
MAWVVGRLDKGHWSERPENALEYFAAERFRAANPDAAIRVLLVDAPISHYGHIERPQQLAGALFTAVRWLASES